MYWIMLEHEQMAELSFGMTFDVTLRKNGIILKAMDNVESGNNV